MSERALRDPRPRRRDRRARPRRRRADHPRGRARERAAPRRARRRACRASARSKAPRTPPTAPSASPRRRREPSCSSSPRRGAIARIEAGELGADEYFDAYAEAAAGDELNAYLWRAEPGSRGAGGEPLRGAPIAVKDLFCTEGIETTAGSRILEGYRPPYTATAVRRLGDAGARVLGKTNMDEFAMGSSNENSGYGPVRNPWDRERVPGGSSGGSAAAVAGGLAPWAIGTDTGRLDPPAGLALRDRRPEAHLRRDLALRDGRLRLVARPVRAVDPRRDRRGPAAAGDGGPRPATTRPRSGSTAGSSCRPHRPERPAVRRRPGLLAPRRGGRARASPTSSSARWRTIEALGGAIEEIELPNAEHGISAYYVIAPAEASANLARYDGVRYGLREPADDPRPMYERTRAAGFGDEVKRRIMLGTYALSSGYYDAYYGRAPEGADPDRRGLRARPSSAVDLIVTPTSPVGRVRARRAHRRPARHVPVRLLHGADVARRDPRDLDPGRHSRRRRAAAPRCRSACRSPRPRSPRSRSSTPRTRSSRRSRSPGSGERMTEEEVPRGGDGGARRAAGVGPRAARRRRRDRRGVAPRQPDGDLRPGRRPAADRHLPGREPERRGGPADGLARGRPPPRHGRDPTARARLWLDSSGAWEPVIGLEIHVQLAHAHEDVLRLRALVRRRARTSTPARSASPTRARCRSPNERAIQLRAPDRPRARLRDRPALDLPPQELLLSRQPEGATRSASTTFRLRPRAGSATSASTASTSRRTRRSWSTSASRAGSTAPARRWSTSTAAARRWSRSSPSPTCDDAADGARVAGSCCGRRSARSASPT